MSQIKPRRLNPATSDVDRGANFREQLERTLLQMMQVANWNNSRPTDTEPKIIVEVGQAFEGSGSLAHSFVDAVAESGADAIKFQLHIATSESSIDDVFRDENGLRKESRFEYWERHELSPSMVDELIEHAKERSIEIGFSTFSIEGLEIVQNSAADFLKIGSGESIQSWFLESAAKVMKPIILSTGLSSYEEIRRAVELFRFNGAGLALMQCVTSYPSALEKVGLNVIPQLRQEFGTKVGLSDHTGSIEPSVFALAAGADLIEVHGTFSRQMQGPDSEASLTFSEIGTLVDFRDAWMRLSRNPVDKDQVAKELVAMRSVFGRSIAFRSSFPQGHKIMSGDLYFAKPGGGLPVEEVASFTGLRLARSVRANALAKRLDFGKS